MKTPAVLLGLLGLMGPLAAPAVAQLIHVSTSLNNAWILFRADSNSIPWDNSPAIVTQLDLYYDARVPIGTINPERTYWHMKAYAPQVRQSFDITGPIDYAEVFDRGLSFVYYAAPEIGFEDFRLTLTFNQSIAPDGPLYPLPPLDIEGHSGFSIHSDGSPYHIEHLVEASGSGDITAITTEFIPVPEPSIYAVGAVLLSIGLIAARRRRDWLCSASQ